MRIFFGIILGVALTIGVAFMSDTLASDPPATTGSGSTVTLDHRQMVNWDVVGDKVRVARERIHATWSRLSKKLES
jgi:hypothetical protein